MRRPNHFLQDDFAVDYGHPSLTANETNDIFTVPADRSAVIDRVLYVNPTGLAASDTSYVVVTVLCNGQVAASWSTKLTGGNGGFTAGSQVAPAVSAIAANINAAAGQKIQFEVTVTGTPTLPAGAIRVEGRLL